MNRPIVPINYVSPKAADSMKTFKGLIDFSLKVLTVTNLWIILFNTFLTYLSYIYPPVIQEYLLRNIAFPNPFKIPLYILLTLTSVITLFVLQKLISFDLKMHIFLKLSFLVTLGLLFLSKLGEYPMSDDYSPYIFRADGSIYTIAIGVLLLVLAFIIVQFTIVSALAKKVRAHPLLLYGVLTVIVAFFTFEPRFPISGHDYSFFFGPILEIIKGKTIYTDIPIQHGLLSILTFTFFYKLSLLNLAYLPLFIWVLYITQYMLSFYLIYKLSTSVGFSLVGLFSIIVLNYFSLSALPASYPQVGPMRWLPSVLTIVLFYKFNEINNRLLIFLIALMSLWLIDAGIALVLGYLLTLFIFFVSHIINLKQTIKSLAWLFISFFLIFAIITIFHFVSGYKTVNVFNIFHSLQKYASLGIAQLPIETHTYFWIVMLIYFASVIYFFRQQNWQVAQEEGFTPNVHPEGFPTAHSGTSERALAGGKLATESVNFHKQLILLSANLMLFTSIYYLGRAHPHNLFNISLLPILTIFLFIALMWAKLKSHQLKIIIALICFILFIAYPAYMRKITMTEMILIKLKGLSAGNIFESEMNNTLTKRYSKETQLIINNLKNDKVAILSNDDTYLFYLTGKKNLLDANPQVGIDTQFDLDHALQNFVGSCPNKIAVDCAVFGRCSQAVGFNQSGFFPQSIFLDSIQKKCAVTYQPVQCTNQLCIAAKK